MTLVAIEGGVKPQSEMRKDIQALRALAVVLVVAFHLFPQAVPAGFVGVDAFFVISGFLITSHLRRELEASGRIRVARFWAARARRLLPASFLVLFVCLICTVTLIPTSYQERFLRETRAALYYALNWKLAVDAVDYWAAEEGASAVQHFWSLSVEEQFYLVWPLLFAGAAFVTRRGARRWAIGLAVAVVLLVSLSLSVRSGAELDPADYFRTWNRAWEFAVGGLIALVSPPRLAPAVASVLAWLGLALVGACAWLLPKAVPFPGSWALVPVVGTALTLWFGGGVERGSVSRALGGRVVQWVGNASYAIYLWHWPLIVFSEMVTNQAMNLPVAFVLVLATCVLAALTKVAVEDPVRYHPFLLARPPWVTFALVALAMAGLTFATALSLNAQEQVTNARHELVARLRKGEVPCFGAHVTSGCTNSEVTGRVLPDPSAAKADHGRFCMANNQGGTRVRPCPRGAKKQPRTTTALVGDSHAAHLLPMLEWRAARRGEQILQFMKGSCPFTVHPRDTSGILRKSCEQFKAKVMRELRQRTEITRVVTSASAGNDLVVMPGLEEFESAVLGFTEAMEQLPPHVREVIVVRDMPRMRRGVIQCLERLGSSARQLEAGACARARKDALIADPLAEAASRLGGRVHLVDFTPIFCDEKVCSPVVHNALAYRDSHHLTETFALTLAPAFALELQAIADERRDALDMTP